MKTFPVATKSVPRGHCPTAAAKKYFLTGTKDGDESIIRSDCFPRPVSNSRQETNCLPAWLSHRILSTLLKHLSIWASNTSSLVLFMLNLKQRLPEKKFPLQPTKLFETKACCEKYLQMLHKKNQYLQIGLVDVDSCPVATLWPAQWAIFVAWVKLRCSEDHEDFHCTCHGSNPGRIHR